MPELRACADELAALDARDRSVQATADEFRDKAIHEAACALVVRKLTAAIAEGNLREGPATADVDRAGLGVLRQGRQGILRRRGARGRRQPADRAGARRHERLRGIRRLQTLVNVSSTPAVVGAVAAVAAKCMDRVQP